MVARFPGFWLCLVVGCVPAEKTSVPPDRAEFAGCVGDGTRRHGPFEAPFEYMTRHVDATLDPVSIAYAADEERSELLEQTDFVYDGRKRLIGVLVDDDGDEKVEFEQTYLYSEDDQELVWKNFDARGHLRAATYNFYAPRYGHLFRTLHDLDGDGQIDEIEAFDWDAEGRLLGVDRWSHVTNRPLTRLTVEYTEDWPRLDRLERFDSDGDNVMDQATWYTYDEDGVLQTTRKLDGTTTTYSFDDDGNLLGSWTEGPSEASTFEATYDRRGLPTWTRVDVDEGSNGTIEFTTITAWTWTCDGKGDRD